MKYIKKLVYDNMFDVVFAKHVDVIVALINDCCGTSYSMEHDQIQLERREIPRNNIYEKSLKCDYIVVINTYYLYNIEINRVPYTGLTERNATYILKLQTSRIPVGATYKEIKKYYATQLNFNGFASFNGLPIDEFRLMSTKYPQTPLMDNLGIFQYDIAFCHNLVYNDGEKAITDVSKQYRWASIFQATSIEELDYILGSDLLPMEQKKKFLSDVEEASRQMEILKNVTLGEDMEGTIQEEIEIQKELAYEEGIERGIKDGIEQGIEQGITQTITATIQSMIKNQLDIELISKITNKSIKEIKEIEKSITD